MVSYIYTGSIGKKRKINTQGFIKIKILCFIGHQQEHEMATHRMGEIICESHTHEDLIFRIYKEFLQLDRKRCYNLILKMGKQSPR